MTELSPCPHCGGGATFTNRDDGWHQAICGSCGCRSNEFPGIAVIAQPKAAASWNARRAPPSRDDIAQILYESDPDNPRSWPDLHAAIENSKDFDRRAELIAGSELYLTLADAVISRL